PDLAPPRDLPPFPTRRSSDLFTLYTLFGSLVWNAVWIGLGFIFGPAIDPVLDRWSGVLSTLVLIVIAAAVLWFIVARVLRLRRQRREEQSAENCACSARNEPLPTRPGAVGFEPRPRNHTSPLPVG